RCAAGLIRRASPPRALPAALSRWSVDAGRIEPVTRKMIDGPCRRITELVGNYLRPLKYYSLPIGTRLRIQTPRAVVGLMVVVGPRSGLIECRGGGKVARRNLFDRWCSYRRACTVILIDGRQDMSRKGVTTLVSLIGQRPDYSVCPMLKKPPPRRTLDVAAVFTV
ncbi:MAG TPA: hypothetical protein VL992_17940, partial [Tepidisphaeraceae bacterium]|nr:hypothetical protein [Tepidisphaeraceae bacterium]